MLSLGWMNSWYYPNGETKIPPIVQQCRQLGHVPTEKWCGPHSCVTIVECSACQYTYKIDSSD